MFEIGKTYNRRADIHGKYSGQQYGGISTPAGYPIIFIFTSDAGGAYGYKDYYGPDDTFWYTGEGQVGDMQMSKSNLAIREHLNNEKQILLFEEVKKGYVRFNGYCEYITHHIEERPDKNDEIRDVIIFHLNIEQNPIGQANDYPEAYENSKQPKKGMSLKELRELANRVSPNNTTKKTRIANIQVRSNAIKLYAKKRANGNCEGCGVEAPFYSKEGPYLEVHHMLRLADGGPDLPGNVIALCPTCHRRTHYAKDSKEYNDKLKEIVMEIENEIDLPPLIASRT